MKKRKLKTKKEKYIFIDTNIYLDYFRLPLDVTALQELKELVRKKKIQLLLPRQVKDEYTRMNKKVISNEIKGKIKACKLEIPKGLETDLLIKDLPQAKDILKDSQKLKGKIETLSDLFKKNDNEIKRIERLIDDIFKKLKTIEEDDILNRAYYRYLRGNPPFNEDKHEKYGDAIIWEALLKKFINSVDINKGELVIITKDWGWYEDRSRKKLNKFLLEEWEEKTKLKKLKLSSYSSLASFINDLTGKEIIKKEEVEKENIFKEYYSPLSRIATFAGAATLVPSPDVFTIKPKSLYCPFCNKDITVELENDFPELKNRTSMNYLTGEYGVSSFGVLNFGGTDKTAKCPYCKNKFNLNNII